MPLLSEPGLWRDGPIWIASDRPLAKWVGRPLANFLRIEAAGGVMLFVAAMVALIWANSPWSAGYEAIWSIRMELSVGSFTLGADLRHWVNDCLMVLFFLVVGLEIKYEMVSGRLRDLRSAMVPIAAAFGGMVVPALIYASLNSGSAGAPGWGIPMATDIAFALGVVALLGRRIPPAARLFLLTLAIVDDIGAIAVIGMFYTDDLSLAWLAAAGGGIVVILGLRWLRVWSLYPYLLAAGFVWLATYQSGVHATIAGVALGLLAPAKPLLDLERTRRYVSKLTPDLLDPVELRRYHFLLAESLPIAERLQHTLHPWSSYVVLPVFALANTGIDLRGGVLDEAYTSSVTAGVVLGLVVGKTIGIVLTSWLVVYFGLGRLPDGLTWGTLSGLAMLAGIGFTVALFIAGLAFPPDSLVHANAKVGIFIASIAAALVGTMVLWLDSLRRPAQ